MPDWQSHIRSRLVSLRLSPTREHEIIEELSLHLEDRWRELVAGGASEDEATTLTLAGFRDEVLLARHLAPLRQAHAREPITPGRGAGHLCSGIARDVRLSIRRLAHERRFTLTALATLALCVGANLAIFAVVDSVLLRALPFPDANRLVTIYNTYPGANVHRDESSLTNYYERRGAVQAFSGMAIQRPGTAVIGEAGNTSLAPIMRVSPEFFEVLGVRPSMGRGFTDAETVFGADAVAVLSDSLWREHFGTGTAVVGQSIRVDGQRRTIVGVLPPEFRYLSSEARLYVPLASDVERRAPAARHFGSAATTIARLAPGVSLAEAQAQIDAHNALVTSMSPSPGEGRMAEVGFRSIVTQLRDDHVASVRPVLLLTQAGVFLLLLIGGVNLVNLMLVRAGTRERELAIRQAIGATRRHVIRSATIETSLLAMTGGLLGLAAGAAGVRAVSTMGITEMPLGTTIVFDLRVATAALAAAAVLGVAFSVPVAWFNLRSRLTSALHSESRAGSTNRSALRLRHAFIVSQVVLAFVLLAGAGLLAVSFENAMAVSPGFNPGRVLSARVMLPGRSYPSTDSRLSFLDRLTETLRAQPGIAGVAVSTNVPLSGSIGRSAARPALDDGESAAAPRGIYSYGVSGDYFDVMGMTIKEGRALTSDDSRRDVRVAVVDEAFAAFHWPDRSAIGRRLFQGGAIGDLADAFTVVGVVGEVKQASVTEDARQGAVYYPYRFRADGSIYVVARTELAPAQLAASLRTAVRTVDPELPLSDIATMDARIAGSLVVRRSPALLAGLFAAMALVLTAVGIYGVLSYAVAQRRREIGVRMALGARPMQIRAQFLSIGIRLFIAGVAIGLPAAWLAGRSMQSLLFNVPALPGSVMLAAVALLGLVMGAACLVPSHRAARLSPMQALADD